MSVTAGRTRRWTVALVGAAMLGLAACTSAGGSAVTVTDSAAGGHAVAGSATVPTGAGASGSPAPRTSSAGRPSVTTRLSASPAAPTSPKASARPSVLPSAVTPAGPSSQAFVSAADLATARAAVARMSTAEKAGSVIMASSADAVAPNGSATEAVAALHLGGVILMGEHGIVDGTTDGTPAQVVRVTAALQAAGGNAAPLLIGTDQEYGDVTRLVHGFTNFPGASTLGQIGDTGLTERIAAAAAQEMLAVGVTVDFAPDADVLPDSGESAIGARSYGSDPKRVGAMVAAAVRGYQSAGLPATLKHFPGIGGIAADTHESLPSLDDSCAQWNSRDRVPMAAGITAGVALVMTGHVRLPAISEGGPTSLDKNVVTDLLRGNGLEGCRGLGFTGVTITDSLQMAPVTDTYGSGDAAVHALIAGQDLLLMPVDPAAAVAGIEKAVADGSLRADRLADAAVRVYALRLATARTVRPSMDVIDSDAHRNLAAEAGSTG